MPRPRSRAAADVQLPAPAPDGEVYVRGSVAAAVVGVSPRAIRQWREAGWLNEADQETGGRRLLIYRLSDVLAVDARLRRVAA